VSRRSLEWSFVQQIGRQVSSYAVFAALALLLPARDFGVTAMAWTWLAFITLFGELGFGVALIQRPNVESRHLSSVFVLNCFLGVLLTAIGIAAAGMFARFYRTPEVGPVAAALSLNFLLNALVFTQTALAQRELRFRQLAIRDISASVVGGVVGVALAYLGFGIWSLVAQALTASAIGTIMLWSVSSWRPHLREASWSTIRELWPYSSRILSSNVLKFFAQNTDRVLIGYLLGPVTLGVYAFAVKIVLTPVSTITSAFGGYLFPAFAQAQADVALVRSMYLHYCRAIASLTLPALVLAWLLAPSLIPMIFGQRWASAVPLIQGLTIVAAAQSFFGPVGELMKALARPAWLFRWSLFFTALAAAALAVGSRWGAAGSVGGLACAYILGLPVVYGVARRLIRIDLRAIGAALRASVLGSAVLGCGTWALLHLQGAPTVPGLVMAGLLGTALYIAVLHRLDPGIFAGFRYQLAGS
jgi:O-antigen/teichoic acid export membrane protein